MKNHRHLETKFAQNVIETAGFASNFTFTEESQ